ncbi:SusC/RagA family TonB-linked outer membrane protein [Persicobacter diffluens]|uniref:SusC/RagA family TonB-linked outer membrane protein n=2 Tax=Persicobacter diffluens TaxID=981 RepID=A0AAN5AMQ2_9BACT|nr:SusC/RagA family TonB-linked outer membrane protein [Persicobacter diffluens]
MGVLIAFLLSTQAVYAQVEIKGTVTASDGEPLPGVSVVIKGSSTGTISDFSGAYALRVNGPEDVLQFTFVGMNTEEIRVGNQTTINVTMQEDVVNLEEFVVVGYGIQRKSDVTGSVASVDAKELQQSLSPNIDQALQGRAAGVSVMSNSGSPGSNTMVRIRGIGSVNNSSPLYVVDGVPLGDISSLNMQDVETMEILKDASATAIYGSRGAHGVVLIQTKSGKKGKTTVNYSGRVGVQSASNYLDLVSAEEYATIRNKARANDQFYYPGEDWSPMPELANPAALGQGTDWQRAVTRDALIHNNQVSVSGGNEKNTYYMAINAMGQDGIMNGSDFSRLTFRLNNSYQIHKDVKVGHNINISHSTKNTIPEWGENVANQKILTNAIGHDPITPVYDPTNPDSPYGYTKLGGNYGNPVARVDYNNNTTTVFGVQGNFFADWNINKHLTFRSNYGLVARFQENEVFVPEYVVSPLQFEKTSSLSKNRANTINHTWSNTLTYMRSFNKHHLTAMVGQEVQTNSYHLIQSSIMDIPGNISKPSFGGGNIGTSAVTDNLTASALVSFFGRVNYNYDDRYLVTANFRSDASSRFGPGNRWGYFPSLALGWNLHKEAFWPENDVVTRAKLTGGYGEIGSQSFDDYMYYSLISGGQYYFFGTDNHLNIGATPLMIGNEDLKWETATTTNVGIEMGFFNDMITFNAEYFVKNTTDMLLRLPIPDYSGIQQAPWVNGGHLKNRGWEFTASHRKQVNDKFSYGIDGNISFIRNEMLDWGTENGFVDEGKFRSFPLLSRTSEGRQIGEFFLWKTDGIFQTSEEVANSSQPDAKPGDIRFVDVNGDGVINEDDRTYVGSPLPDFTYGFTLSLNYGHFDFSAFFQGVQGNQVFNGMRYYTDRAGVFNNHKRMLNAWDGPGSSNTVPRLTERDAENNLWASDYYLEDGAYLRLKNLEIGYSLPSVIASRLKMQNLRVYLSGQNLLTFTKYTGMDPEVGQEWPDKLAFGIDRGMYPQPRIFSLGLDVTF